MTPPRRLCVGLDLAWSERNPSGIALVDGAGRLLDSSTVRGDDDVAAWLARLPSPPAVVAIDAPLIVANQTGRRPVEAELAAAYGSADAGPLPSNRGNPLFDPPRGARLAGRLGWEITSTRPAPSSTTGASAAAPTRAVEVYPHPAMVVLFGLERVIPYKARGRRTVADRTAALGVLVRHLAAIEPLRAAESPRWPALTEALRVAPRPVELKRIEDELDGIFCAHLAWLWATESPSLRVWGDDVAGFVVAPDR